MNCLLTIGVVFIFSFLIPNVFAEIDLSNKQLVSSNESLIVEFSDNQESLRALTTEINPQINFGIISFNSLNFILDDGTINVLGKSFVIKTDNVLVYSRALGVDTFQTNVYYLTDDGLKLNHFTTSLISIEPDVQPLESSSNIITEVHYLVSSPENIKPKQEFHFAVKTFDKSIYAGSNFENFVGKLDGVNITAIILDLDGKVIHEFEGKTKNGIFESSILVPERIWGSGWKKLNIELEYEGETYSFSKSFYLFANPDTSARD